MSVPQHMDYNYIVLVGEYLGGAEIFTLVKIRSGTWKGRLVMNPALASCLHADPAYRDIPVLVLDELEPLAARIRIPALRAGAKAIDHHLADARILFGNLKAAAMQLVARRAGRRDSFMHDNCTYLNSKARFLISMICLRSRHSYFACEHARQAVPLVGRALSSTSVHYFADIPEAPRQGQAPVKLRIMNIGRIEANKGQLLAARIAVRLRAYFPHVSVTLVGTIFEPSYYEEVRAALSGHDLSMTQITVSHDDVEPTMRKHDLVLHTSTVESLPLVLFEAAAAGIPFFALPVGGIPEVLPRSYQLSGDPDADALHIAREFGALADTGADEAPLLPAERPTA